MRPLDDEIRDVELRLTRRRNGLAVLAGDWAESLRDTLVSGKSLLGVAAVGFAVGELLHPFGRAGRASGRGGGVLLGLASLLVRARFAFPWSLAWSALQTRRPDKAARTAAPL